MHRQIRRPQTPGVPTSVCLIDPDTAPMPDDLAAAAYAVGVSEQPYRRFATWIGWPGPSPQAAIVFYEIGEPTIAFCLGRREGIEPILDAATELPPTLYTVCPHGHISAFERHYRFDASVEMLRMVLPEWSTPPETHAPVERLTSDDVAELLDILKPHGMRIDPMQLHHGRYFGVRQPSRLGPGKLASVAAAHFVSPKHGLALVGNVVTRPKYRGLGYAKAAVSALIHNLRPQIDTICLDVCTSNHTAVNLYETLGFTPRGKHIEAFGRRLA